MASEQLTNLSKLTSQRTRGALTIESIMQTPDSSSGTNDTARSDESVASSNVVIPADQLGKNQQLPDFSPAPAKSTLDSQLMDIQNQALAIQDKVNQPAPAEDFRTGIQSGLVDLINRDLTGEKGDIRERYDTENKEKLARDLSNEATAIKRDYEAQIRALKENPEGKLRGALQADINQLTEDGNLALSEKMFQYSIANGDFQQAEKLALQAIGDLEKADERRLKLFETAWNFVQNDLSESEKLQIQQTFQQEEAERQSERDIMMTQFRYELDAPQRAFDNMIKSQNLNLAIGKYNQAQAKNQQEMEAKDSAVRLQAVNSKIVLDNVVEALGQQRAVGTSGLTGQIASKVAGTQAYDLNNTIATIKSKIGFAELQAMRDASPTGGALGQVSERELFALQSALGSLEIGQSQKQLQQNLVDVYTHYENWLETVGYTVAPDGEVVKIID